MASSTKCNGFPFPCNHVPFPRLFILKILEFTYMVHFQMPLAPHNSHFSAFNLSIRLVVLVCIMNLGSMSILLSFDVFWRLKPPL